MTQKESESFSRSFGRLEEMMSNFIESNKEYKEFVKNELSQIHLKIDMGQLSDKAQFEELKNEVYNDETGLRVRTASLEKTRSNFHKSVAFLTGGGFLTVVMAYFKEKIIALFNML